MNLLHSLFFLSRLSLAIFLGVTLSSSSCGPCLPAMAAAPPTKSSSPDQDETTDEPDDSPAPIFFRRPWTGPVIITDRNSVSPHPNTVPAWFLQIENGATLEKLNRSGSYNFPESLFRFGLPFKTELRFTTPNYFYLGRERRVEGATDITVAIKKELQTASMHSNGFDVGLIAGLGLPTGTRPLRSRYVDPFVQTILYKRFLKNWTLGTAQSIFVNFFDLADQGDPTDPANILSSTPLTVYQATAILYRHFGNRMDLWGEYAGDFTRSGSTQLMDFGVLYRPLPDQQLDFRFGVGLNRPAPRAFVGFGYSILVGRMDALLPTSLRK